MIMPHAMQPLAITRAAIGTATLRHVRFVSMGPPAKGKAGPIAGTRGQGFQPDLGECWCPAQRSFVVQFQRKPLAVHHPAVLRDRHVDAGAAFSIDQFDGLRHCVGIFPAVLLRFEAKARAVHARVLRPLFGCQRCEPTGKFHAVCPFSFRPSHDADPRERRRSAERRDQDQRFHCGLPFRGLVLSPWKLRDVIHTWARAERAAAGIVPNRKRRCDQRRSGAPTCGIGPL